MDKYRTMSGVRQGAGLLSGYEKPSVGQAYAKVLGVRDRHDGYLEGSGYIVSW